MTEFTIDPNWRERATDREREYMDAVVQFGGVRSATAALGLANHSVVSRAIRRAKNRYALHLCGLTPEGGGAPAEDAMAATKGWAPSFNLEQPVPEPFVVRGYSTYYDKDGEKRGQWVLARQDHQKYLEMVRETIKGFYRDSPPLPLPEPATADVDRDVIPWVQVGDGHLGMLAHASETGQDFNLEIAERELCGAIDQIVAGLGHYERIVLNDLGDMTHFDNITATTAHSGHQLSFDRGLPVLIRVYSRVMRHLVERLTTRCEVLDVIVNQGNHSRVNDLWMAELLRVAFGTSGRVNVIDNSSPFVGYRMGKTFVLTHHSDKVKPQDLVNIMITDFREDFGEAEYAYADLGHIHHKMAIKEVPGVVVESWNTLAPSDNWHHESGYRSRQSISVAFRSRTYGDVGRRVLPIKMIRDAINRACGGSGAGELAHAPRRAFCV